MSHTVALSESIDVGDR